MPRALIAVLVFAVACGSESSSEPAVNRVGDWSGTTSQDKAMSFGVTSSGVDAPTFTYVLQGTKCGYTSTISIPTPDGLHVTSNHFSMDKTQLGQALFVYATGDFTGAADATGTFTVQDGQCGDTLNLTWTAKKGS
ncbi:MAG TPA: hypothetical protein VE967_15780 [Gemmatimonadaceae bacterium]|nr:hypothetical protein [Gemmatimonadaceae bacterium]